MNIIDRLVRSIPTADIEEARQQRLLSILLAILLVTSLVQEVVYLILIAIGHPPAPMATDPDSFWRGEIFTWLAVLAVVVVYLVNRYWSRRIGRYLFVLILAVSVFTNTPDNWMLATLTFALSISVFIASFLLRSYASFIVAGVSGVAVTAVSIVADTGIYLTPIFNFFAMATLSQIIARNLEHTLDELRILNLELDHRVQDRTRELAESLSKTEAILESTADGVIVFDNDGQATVANPAIAYLMDKPAEEVIGRDVRALLEHDEETEDDRETVISLVSTGGASESTLTFRWGSKTLSTTVAPVQVESLDETIGTVAVFRDFTREAEIDRMKSTFVSIASHELRTPLNAIMGYTEMLQEGLYGPLSDEQRDATERILANTSHMLNLARNLLDRAQIEAGTLKLNVASFSPADAINEATGAMEVLARNKGLELTGAVAEDIPAQVTGDRQRVNQIVVNLIGNALKFTHEGGVHVRGYRLDEERWAIAVSDTGIGIPKEAQEYIFEPFRRVHESPTREYRGAGLGLSIVRQLAAMMGGEVTLESEPGQGSTFTILLPLAPPAPREAEGEGEEGQR